MNSFVMDGDTALHMGRYLFYTFSDNVNMLLNLPSGISITDINNVKIMLRQLLRYLMIRRML